MPINLDMPCFLLASLLEAILKIRDAFLLCFKCLQVA